MDGTEEGGVRCTRPDGGEERVALAELEAVIIETNNTGPWGADVWWQLLGQEQTGCAEGFEVETWQLLQPVRDLDLPGRSTRKHSGAVDG